jgi:hypothetical protein
MGVEVGHLVIVEREGVGVEWSRGRRVESHCKSPRHDRGLNPWH